MKILNKALDFVEEIVAVVLMAFMTIMNFANVISRYLLGGSLSYTEEFILTAFVWITMFGAATAYKRGAHLGMSFIVERFPKKGQALWVAFSMACSLLLLVLMTRYGINVVQNQIKLNSVTPATGMPAWVQSVAIPVGAVIMIIRTLQYSITEFIKLWKDGGNK